jgi:hypothetical protein
LCVYLTAQRPGMWSDTARVTSSMLRPCSTRIPSSLAANTFLRCRRKTGVDNPSEFFPGVCGVGRQIQASRRLSSSRRRDSGVRCVNRGGERRQRAPLSLLRCQGLSAIDLLHRAWRSGVQHGAKRRQVDFKRSRPGARCGPSRCRIGSLPFGNVFRITR